MLAYAFEEHRGNMRNLFLMYELVLGISELELNKNDKEFLKSNGFRELFFDLR